MSESRIPRGVRNNNPLNIKRQRGDKWIGMSSVQNDKTFVQFQNMDYGWRAAFIILRKYFYKYGINTIHDIIHRWAPVSENDTAGYIRIVCRHTGLGENQPLGGPHENTGRWMHIAYAMACVECGYTNFDISHLFKGYDMAVYATRQLEKDTLNL